MKVESLVFISACISIANAAAAPRNESPFEDNAAYPNSHTSHHLGIRIPEALQIREDVVTVTINDCIQYSMITEYAPGFSTSLRLPVPSVQPGGSLASPPISVLDGQPIPTGFPITFSSGISSRFTKTNPGSPSTAATSSNSPPTDSPSNCANGPASRNCWNNCTIGTDYEKAWPVTDVTREYWLTVENGTLAPDGFSRQVLTFNGTIPGPLITANWGDTLKIHVTNNLQNNGTGVHWHGFRQLNTNDQDGTNGITECPLAPGQTKTYEFVATTYGTSWYHSHFSTQYGDGAVGPVVINGPASADYDQDLGPVVIQDWYHQTVFQAEWFAQHVAAPTADNYLLNGVNAAVGSTAEGNRLTFKFTKGKKYLIRLVNAGTDQFVKVAMDGHKFTVIANDFVPITPFETDIIPLGIGQRYDVIVEAIADVGNYWFRAISQKACAENVNDGLGTANGIITYDGAPSGLPNSTVANIPNDCHDIPSANLVPLVSRTVPTTIFSSVDILAVGGPVLANTSYGSNVFTWSLDGNAIDIDWNNPTLLQLQNGVTNFSAAENVVKLDTANIWIYWIVQNQFAVPHPMHLHGHDFALLGQGNGTFDASTEALNFNNPTRRDTAMLVENGWTVIAFETDNPGAWLFHCHIGWHVGGGLSLQFLEREADILKTVKADAAFTNTCNTFSAYANSAADVYGKTDSGL